MSGALLLPIYILLFLALIWFLMIRPQQRRRRELQNLIDRLAPGDDVVTVSGLYGTVTEIEEMLTMHPSNASSSLCCSIIQLAAAWVRK